VSPRIKYEPTTTDITTTTSTTTTTFPTTTTLEETTISMSNLEAINRTSEVFEHANNMTTSTEDNTNSTSPSTMSYYDEINSTVSDNNTTNEAQMPMGNVSTNINEDESSTYQPRLFQLLANLSQDITTEYPTTQTSFIDNNSTIMDTTVSSSSVNPCTLENLRANFVYHEYLLDKHKFIFCDSEGKMNIIACSPNYIWSQNEQSCVLPN
jgi:hypothetical protein